MQILIHLGDWSRTPQLCYLSTPTPHSTPALMGLGRPPIDALLGVGAGTLTAPWLLQGKPPSHVPELWEEPCSLKRDCWKLARLSGGPRAAGFDCLGWWINCVCCLTFWASSRAASAAGPNTSPGVILASKTAAQSESGDLNLVTQTDSTKNDAGPWWVVPKNYPGPWPGH